MHFCTSRRALAIFEMMQPQLSTRNNILEGGANFSRHTLCNIFGNEIIRMYQKCLLMKMVFLLIGVGFAGRGSYSLLVSSKRIWEEPKKRRSSTQFVGCYLRHSSTSQSEKPNFPSNACANRDSVLIGALISKVRGIIQNRIFAGRHYAWKLVRLQI